MHPVNILGYTEPSEPSSLNCSTGYMVNGRASKIPSFSQNVQGGPSRLSSSRLTNAPIADFHNMPGHVRYTKLGEEFRNGHDIATHNSSSEEHIPDGEDHIRRPERSKCWQVLGIIAVCHLLVNVFWTLALALTWKSLCWDRPSDEPHLIHCE